MAFSSAHYVVKASDPTNRTQNSKRRTVHFSSLLFSQYRQRLTGDLPSASFGHCRCPSTCKRLLPLAALFLIAIVTHFEMRSKKCVWVNPLLETGPAEADQRMPDFVSALSAPYVPFLPSCSFVKCLHFKQSHELCFRSGHPMQSSNLWRTIYRK